MQLSCYILYDTKTAIRGRLFAMVDRGGTGEPLADLQEGKTNVQTPLSILQHSMTGVNRGHKEARDE